MTSITNYLSIMILCGFKDLWHWLLLQSSENQVIFFMSSKNYTLKFFYNDFVFYDNIAIRRVNIYLNQLEWVA